MSKLYTYCIINDHGAAPNPFWGLCTLAICKPRIRKAATVGDWVAATGSVRHGIANRLVYVMKVAQVLSLEEYDAWCRNNLPKKIPLYKTTDLRRKVGDCIYDYATGSGPLLRPSVHQQAHRATDLSGKNVLLSDEFYYFGSKPVPLPSHLLPIVRQGQGFRSDSNAPYQEQFVEWITTFKKHKNKVVASPQGLNLYINEDGKSKCSQTNLKDDIADEPAD